MLLILRVIIVVIYSLLVCIGGVIYCLFSPRNPKNVAIFGRFFGYLAPALGLRVGDGHVPVVPARHSRRLLRIWKGRHQARAQDRCVQCRVIVARQTQVRRQNEML